VNEEIKDEWINRLRSGRYRQGKSRLQTLDGRYCCLGVLCELAREREVIEFAPTCEHGPNLYHPAGNHLLGSTTSLPDAVRVWAGLTANDPVIGDNELSSWNDDRNATFGEIADLIEENL
jgi:hypothetical protein